MVAKEEPDPNPVILSLPWSGDLQVTNNGSLAFVSGVEKVRQRIIRRFFTSPQQILNDGTFIPADYLFDPNYGIGARRLVGEKIDRKIAAELQRKIYQAVLVDESVNSSLEPEVELYAARNGQIWARVKVTLTDATVIYLNFPAK